MRGSGAVVGDEADFTAIFPELYSRCYRVAYRILGDRGEAEEVAQEALARAFARWRTIRAEPLPWCVRVTGNLAIDGVRARGRHRRLDARVSRQLVDRSETTDSEDAVSDRMVLGAALAHLSRRQRQVVLLRYVADLPESQVAGILNCSVGSVKSHGARGLATLRKALGAADADSRRPSPTRRPPFDTTLEG